MLVRFIVDNVLSFGDETEFNMLPQARLRTHPHHKYNTEQFPLLKMSALYGANGAGKSNLVKAIDMLLEFIREEEIPSRLSESTFKFSETPRPQRMGIEFIVENESYFYGVEIFQEIVISEELYFSGLGKKDDILIFDRKTTENGETTLTFSSDLEKDENIKLLKSVILENFVFNNKSIFKLLHNRRLNVFSKIKESYEFICGSIIILGNNSYEFMMESIFDILISPERLSMDNLVKKYNLGINSFSIKKSEIEDLSLYKRNQYIKNIKNELYIKNPDSVTFDEFITYENGKLILNKLLCMHNGISFSISEESDGTQKLIQLLPVIITMIEDNVTIIIDEIERSIHPLLIKELVRKFSEDPDTKGQLIFTTHESNLLDLDLFRQDEIWFAEKKPSGSTHLYSLSDFREHTTTDIRKGYLSGRYGSIPFLGNLHDLNWHTHGDLQEQKI